MQPLWWAKTVVGGQPGISVRDHCLNVGSVAEALLAALPKRVRVLLPAGSGMLAALHDVGKITVGFQAKCPQWLHRDGLPNFPRGEVELSVTDHALVTQVFLQKLLSSTQLRLWAVAVGAHHGRPKGRNARLNRPEALAEWAEENRLQVLEQLWTVFGPLPITPPAPHHSDLWLLAGLISVADWIGSNEAWFSPEHGLPPDEARQQARGALRQIGWPGGKLRQTGFSAAFASDPNIAFEPNALQRAVAAASHAPGVVVVEGPMGCNSRESISRCPPR
ncbi:MAG: CRISPR-associated endonuclease Cas3'' [Verrucomicrobiota bacterium]|nr:CRISPR-associated endonuclease Cas3'' [Verrucomicrobiota bacterium]